MAKQYTINGGFIRKKPLNTINGKSPPEKPLENFYILCIGNGNASAYIGSVKPENTPILVLTDHPTNSNKIRSQWGYSDMPYNQTKDIVVVEKYLKDARIRGKSVAIVVTTYPEKGKEWLNILLYRNQEVGKLITEYRDSIVYVLPHSPNPYHSDFTKTGSPVIQFDYFSGAGTTAIDNNGVTIGNFGVKENTMYAISYTQDTSSESIDKLDILVQHLTANQNHKKVLVQELDMLPTNAVLHATGMLAHIAKALVDEGLVDTKTLNARTPEDFFVGLNYAVKVHSPERFREAFKRLVNISFYSHMPEVGPNVLMEAVGSLVIKVRDALVKSNKMTQSILDIMDIGKKYPTSHPAGHLISKYEGEWKKANGKDPNHVGVSLAEFINKNPAYQNPSMVFPMNADGTINTKHRFFQEDIPTLEDLYSRGKEQKGLPPEELAKELDVLRKVIDYLEVIRHLYPEKARSNGGGIPPLSSASSSYAQTPQKFTTSSSLRLTQGGVPYSKF